MHGLDRIHQQIQGDLLQLDFVASYAWQSIIKLRLQVDLMLLKLMAPERYNRLDPWLKNSPSPRLRKGRVVRWP
jgi:hypothetical protein